MNRELLQRVEHLFAEDRRAEVLRLVGLRDRYRELMANQFRSFTADEVAEIHVILKEFGLNASHLETDMGYLDRGCRAELLMPNVITP
jgi:hypothetical protein